MENRHQEPEILLVESSLLSAAHGLFKEFADLSLVPAETIYPAILPEDIFNEEAPILPNEPLTSSLADPTDEIQDLYDFYKPPSAGEQTTREGFSLNPKVEHHPYELHLAARDGDIYKITHLIKSGTSVNALDTRNSTPLHVAVLFNQLKAIQYLLWHGASVDALSYRKYTPLHLALYKEHYEIARFLVSEAKADPLKKTDEGINALTLLTDQIHKKIAAFTEKKISASQLTENVSDMIETLKVFSEHCGKYVHYSPASIEGGVESHFPLSLGLKIIASSIPNRDLREEILQLASEIASRDPTEALYVTAKNFLHVFPTGNEYEIKMEQGKSFLISADGYFSQITTKMLYDSFVAFLDQLKTMPADPLKMNIFEEIASICKNAAIIAQHAADPKLAKDVFLELYQEGKTLLLPSGWKEHFVGITLSKPQALFAISNSGDKFTEDGPGTTLFHIQEPDKITPSFIFDIINNKKSMTLEFENLYQYGLIEKAGHISGNFQKYDNCAWQNNVDAVKGLIFIELLNHQVPAKEAHSLMSAYYHEWDHFNGHYQIEQYLNNSPALPIQALVDVYGELRQKVFEEDDVNAKAHAQKIIEVLNSPLYFSEFNEMYGSPSQEYIAPPSVDQHEPTLLPHTDPEVVL